MKNYYKKIEEITAREKKEMYGILSKYFLGTSYEAFLSDLSQKELAIFIAKESKVIGFSTLVCYKVQVEDELVPVIFSGDTIVEREYRNSAGLGVEMAHYFERVRERYAKRTVYYLLTTKGWRTYKVLPFFFNTFYPRVGVETPIFIQTIIDRFSFEKYQERYDAISGLVMAEENPQRIRSENLYDADYPKRENEEIDFFFKKNPNYLDGTELVCIASIDEENMGKRFKRLNR